MLIKITILKQFAQQNRYTALHRAVNGGQIAVIEALVSASADVFAVDKVRHGFDFLLIVHSKYMLDYYFLFTELRFYKKYLEWNDCFGLGDCAGKLGSH